MQGGGGGGTRSSWYGVRGLLRSPRRAAADQRVQDLARGTGTPTAAEVRAVYADAYLDQTTADAEYAFGDGRVEQVLPFAAQQDAARAPNTGAVHADNPRGLTLTQRNSARRRWRQLLGSKVQRVLKLLAVHGALTEYLADIAQHLLLTLLVPEHPLVLPTAPTLDALAAGNAAQATFLGEPDPETTGPDNDDDDVDDEPELAAAPRTGSRLVSFGSWCATAAGRVGYWAVSQLLQSPYWRSVAARIITSRVQTYAPWVLLFFQVAPEWVTWPIRFFLTDICWPVYEWYSSHGWTLFE